MPPAARAVTIALALVAGWLAHDRVGAPRAAAPGATQALSAADRAATWTFAPSVSPLNRQAFAGAIGRLRPEARALLAAVDGLVTVDDAEPPSGALAVAIPDGGRYTVRFRFGPVFAELGQRGLDRVIAHELGHVVDAVLVDEALAAWLDALVPAGVPCEAGTQTGSCAPREERFAETFAKWATGDLGVNIYAGYAVPPPADLESWGRALVTPPA